MKVGRKPNALRLYIRRRYGIKPTRKPSRYLTNAFCEQVAACKSEAARRLILGVSKKR